MQPNYTVFIDVCVEGLCESDDIWLRRVQYTPFVPRVGDRLRLTNSDNECILIEFDSVYYDMDSHAFVVENIDAAVTEAQREGTVGNITADTIAVYVQFDFARLNFPGN